MEKIKKFFKLEQRGTSVRTELIGGLVTFLAMAYILFVNPNMLGLNFADPLTLAPGVEGFPVGGVFVATALAAGVATILMGVYTNYPIALAPGMGINAVVAYSMVAYGGYTWQEALVVVLFSGLIFLALSLTPVRKWIVNAVPLSLKKAIGAGIGFFIAFIGFANAKIIIANPDTIVSFGDFTNPSVLLALFGIILVFALFVIKHKIARFALILAMIATAVVGVVLGLLGVSGMPAFGGSGYTDLNTFGDTLFGFVDGFGAFSHPSVWILLFTLVYLDIFDTSGTLIAVSGPAGLLNEKGELENVDRAMLVDAIGTTFGAVVGTSTVTSYIESSAGIESGARTGLSSVVVGVLFLVSIVAYPVFSIFISSSALTSMALVLVGVMMFAQIKDIDWSDLPVLASAFIIVIVMMLSYSIGNGIAFGFIAYVIMMMVQKRFKEISPMMYTLAGFFVIYFVLTALFM